MAANVSMAVNRGLHRFAVLTAGATLGLIFAGGLVTSTGSGLAVPDWPLSYGQLMPPMVGGVAFEHGHRMAAATVGFLMLVLAVWIFRREQRRWVGLLAALAMLAVVLQGALGGLTVLLLLPPAVSVAHACLAQAFLCLTVALAVVTGPAWIQMETGPPGRTPSPLLLRMVTALPAIVFVQLVLGAVMRHTHAGLAIPDFPLSYGRLVPPLTTFPVIIHFAHRAWGVVVAVAAIGCAARVLVEMRRTRGERLLVRPALIAAGLVLAQILLGGAIIWTTRAVIPTTLHVATGAAILAGALILALRCHRLAWAGRGARAVSAPGLSAMESPA
jgi:cytochrome c oxidase assembly protein subunit 15